jgi:phosphoenolpyruvate synthase/pyruvate phosphate dikinase
VHIVWLEQPICQEVQRVGGKVANLSRLAADYRVPPGFCLTTAAYGAWAEAGSGDWPAELVRELNASYAKMAERCEAESLQVAVRSSAIDEDGQSASFAGQYETYLNMIGAEAVIDAVTRCWASTRSEQVLEYRRQNDLPVDDVQIAVLVQQMVPADIAGVAFSANPVNKNRDEVVINTSWGLGESVVSGTVSPDTYVVSKSDLKVLEREIAEKEKMTVAHPDGTREVDVPRFMRGESTLDDAKAIEIAQLARVLEQQMGWPVDIECAYHEEILYLLQCRPITTLD